MIPLDVHTKRNQGEYANYVACMQIRSTKVFIHN